MDQQFIFEFEKDLPKLKSVVFSMLYSRQKDYPADEIINEAFLKLHDKEENYCFHSFKSLCFTAIMDYGKSRSACYYSEGFIGEGFQMRGEDKCCCGCKKIFPVSYFSILRQNALGTITYQSICRECVRINSKKWASINPEKVTASWRRQKAKAKLLRQTEKALLKKLKPQIDKRRRAELSAKLQALKLQYAS